TKGGLMPKVHKKTTQKDVASVLASVPEHRPGMPAADSVEAVTVVAKYKIIHTKEVDAYEEGALGPGWAAPALPSAPVGDNFAGTARKAAKLSISAANLENFKDLKDLIKSLVADAKMIAHKPKITTAPTSKRVKEEERNIRAKAFLYA